MFSEKILEEKSKCSSSVCEQTCSHLTKSYLLITVHFLLPLEIKGADGYIKQNPSYRIEVT